MKVIWTKEAKEENRKNIVYLRSNWTKREIRNYRKKLRTVIEILERHPEAGRYDEDLGLRKFLVVKQIYLFYEIKNNQIVLTSLWNNYQNPYWL